jgi:hypothetical protein
MSVLTRPLTGSTVGLSISNGKETTALGFSAPEVNRTTLRIVVALLGQGAGITFGHDWRDDGVMDSVHAFVERFYSPLNENHHPPLINLVVWPDKPRLDEADRQRLKDTLNVEEVGLPPELRNYMNDTNPILYPYLRSRALTHLRRRLTGLSNARICLGGKLSDYSGRYPGIVEEAYLAIRAGQPIFMAGLLGGATCAMINALKQINTPTDLCPEVPVARFYRERQVEQPQSENLDDLQWSSQAVWQAFATLGVDGLSDLNQLSVEENHQLFTTQSVEGAIELILTGLGRAKRR